MKLGELFKRKDKGQYETEHFKNKVKIDELEEKLKIKSQRDKIQSMKSKLYETKGSGGGGGGLSGFMEGMGNFAQRAGHDVGRQKPQYHTKKVLIKKKNPKYKTVRVAVKKKPKYKTVRVAVKKKQPNNNYFGGGGMF